MPDKVKNLFRTLLDLLRKEGMEEAIKGTIVDNIFGFIYDTEHVQLAMHWLEAGHIFHPDQQGTTLFELSKSNKY